MTISKGIEKIILFLRLGLLTLMNHPYGNYVVQRLFECSDEKLRRLIYERTLTENMEEIRKNNYGIVRKFFIDNL